MAATIIYIITVGGVMIFAFLASYIDPTDQVVISELLSRERK